jgi:transcriptional regulator with GAF, ATPase, and Fis domain
MKKDNTNPDDLKIALDELRAINNVLDKICRIRETNHIMKIIISELINLTEADQGVINLISPAKDQNLATVIRINKAEPDGIPFKIHDSICGWVIENKKQLKIDDLNADSRFTGFSSKDNKIMSVVCCPMYVRDEIIGLTSLIRGKDKPPFGEEQCRLAGIISAQSAHILSNALLLEELAANNQLLEVSQGKLHEENTRLKGQLGSTFVFENLIGKSQPMKDVLTLLSKVSGNDSPALILGETGTGKDLIARAIHFNSSRKDKNFVVKNCSIKTETLLESELFGHIKGSFTGAVKDKTGLFKEANGGTIFLDEIGDAPLSTQAAILRVIENGEIRPIGASTTEFVNVRVISATNKDLKAEIKKGTFREDLFYRLNTFLINLPPLRQRPEDIPLLVNHFLRKLKIKLNCENLAISPDALDAITRYSWPGNVRQLENELERAAVVCDNKGVIDIHDLSAELATGISDSNNSSVNRGQLREAVEQVEKELIVSSLHKNKGNILQTAKVLGLTRKGLKDKMVRYGLRDDTKDDELSNGENEE